ncbi:uncharacterized protein BXZ73DRAFT_99069 [Epithele typhae]|uniref:uncharacterized protein n=1 Tax=Epithele typhae TaxID=378194 RepID=UPI0020079F9E|nr:uncharacterized protein BXZ73DRAFT_99069 [Epithele typhae]KAH9940069.1 hypothetical protein BXZ73DRAFT_99069 [Epithele typhae]
MHARLWDELYTEPGGTLCFCSYHQIAEQLDRIHTLDIGPITFQQWMSSDIGGVMRTPMVNLNSLILRVDYEDPFRHPEDLARVVLTQPRIPKLTRLSLQGFRFPFCTKEVMAGLEELTLGPCKVAHHRLPLMDLILALRRATRLRHLRIHDFLSIAEFSAQKISKKALPALQTLHIEDDPLMIGHLLDAFRLPSCASVSLTELAPPDRIEPPFLRMLPDDPTTRFAFLGFTLTHLAIAPAGPFVVVSGTAAAAPGHTLALRTRTAPFVFAHAVALAARLPPLDTAYLRALDVAVPAPPHGNCHVDWAAVLSRAPASVTALTALTVRAAAAAVPVPMPEGVLDALADARALPRLASLDVVGMAYRKGLLARLVRLGRARPQLVRIGVGLTGGEGWELGNVEMGALEVLGPRLEGCSGCLQLWVVPPEDGGGRLELDVEDGADAAASLTQHLECPTLVIASV